MGGPCACVVGDLALARVRCVSAAWAWGWLLVCVLGDLALGRVRCVWAALGCFAVLRFGFDMCPPIPRILPSSNPHPQLLHHEIHSATSAFCTLLLLFATSCATNFVLPPPPVSPRFFILPHLPSDPLKPRFPRISACVHLRACMCYLLTDQCNSAIRRPARQASPINLAFFRPSFGSQGALRQFGAQPD